MHFRFFGHGSKGIFARKIDTEHLSSLHGSTVPKNLRVGSPARFQRNLCKGKLKRNTGAELVVQDSVRRSRPQTSLWRKVPVN